MLHFVPTPIGNLNDMTPRAIEVLRDVDLILAEDTRVTGRLLKHFEIETQMRSFHQNNEHKVLDQIGNLLQSGQNIALVTDAGTPGISDPGFLLSRYCREHDIKMSCLPGAIALAPALVMSGLPCDRFHFEGFLPPKKGRQIRLQYLSNLEHTFVLYVSPHKIEKTLIQLIEHCTGSREASLSREISKLYEEVLNGTLAEILNSVQSRASLKGEIVLVVAGKS